MLACVYSHRHEHTLCTPPPACCSLLPLPLQRASLVHKSQQNGPWDCQWLGKQVPRYLRSCPLSSDATSSMWTWSHSWEMEKRADAWRDLFQSAAPVQTGLAHWDEPVGMTAPKSKPINQYRLFQVLHIRILLSIKEGVKVSVCDVASYCCAAAWTQSRLLE